MLLIWTGSIYSVSFLTTGSQNVFFPLPYFSEIPHFRSLWVFLGYYLVSTQGQFPPSFFTSSSKPLTCLLPSYLPSSAQQSPSVAMSSPLNAEIHPDRFTPSRGAATVSWAPELLYLGVESPLTHKHHGTISHSTRSLQGPPSSHLGLLDRLSTLLSSLSFPSSGIFSKPPCISTPTGLGGDVRCMPIICQSV